MVTGLGSFLILINPITNNNDYRPDEDMKIELKKAKSKRKPPPGARHPHIHGRYVEFDIDVMSPQEPTPTEGSSSSSSSEGQAELEEFQDATESPSTVGGHPCDCGEGHESGDHGDHSAQPRAKKLTVNTDQAETDNDGHHHDEQHEGAERRNKHLPVNGNRVEGEVGSERDPEMDGHDDRQSMDGSTDSDSEDGDGGGKWNAVCVACLRVYSRDPDLTITLVNPEDKQGASNLVTGHEPAGATM